MIIRRSAAVLISAAALLGTAAVPSLVNEGNIVTASPVILGEATGKVDNVNPWGNGGQITLTLSGCAGYETITVVVEFSGTVDSASGWGFDTYTVSGNRVTAVVSATGANSWGFDGNVGIQVSGSGIDSASLISVTGEGSYSGGNNGGGGNNGSGSSQTQETGVPTGEVPDAPVPEGVQGDDWLTTDGDKITDMNGTEVWLTGCNWFGYNTGTNIFDGVWNCNLKDALKGIADHGFNLLRVPISAELLLQWSRGEYPTANYNQAYNSELNGMNSLEIFDYVLTLCSQNGMKVMLDIHSANTDASGHNAPLWYTDRISAEQYLEALDWVSARYADNDTIIAYDLKNEPHGKASETEHAIWNDSTSSNNWKYVAEQAGNIVLDNNPHALIMIEGIQIFPIDPVANNFTSTDDEDYYNSWWGGNLRAVEYYPIDFGSPERNAQIVYSPHDYGPAVYAQPWFEGGFTYQSLMDDYWYDAWLYIDDQEIAPLLIGEWGGFMSGDNLTWLQYMRDLIAEYHLNHTFWCYNANSGDTGGLVLDDFVTWDTEKYDLVESVLWQTSDGTFIGLDHAVPLGSNGMSLSDYSGLDIEPAEPVETVDAGETVTTTASGSAEVSDATVPDVSSSGSDAAAASDTIPSNGTDPVVTDSSEKTSGGSETHYSSPLKIVLIVFVWLIGIGFILLVGRFIGLLASGHEPRDAVKRLFRRR